MTVSNEVHFGQELLLQATVETFDALYLQDVERLIHDGAVGQRVGFSCVMEI